MEFSEVIQNEISQLAKFDKDRPIESLRKILRGLKEGDVLTKVDVVAIGMFVDRHEAMCGAIRGLDFNTRYSVSYLQAFIGHHRDPDFRNCPNLTEAEEHWRKANDYNVKVCNALLKDGEFAYEREVS